MIKNYFKLSNFSDFKASWGSGAKSSPERCREIGAPELPRPHRYAKHRGRVWLLSWLFTLLWRAKK